MKMGDIFYVEQKYLEGILPLKPEQIAVPGLKMWRPY